MSHIKKNVTILGSISAALLAYSTLIERNMFILKHISIPLIAKDKQPIKILHISDLHFCPWQKNKKKWIQSLADLNPDFIINTGDNFGHISALPIIFESLEPLLQFPGVFVPGSNDYYAPKPKNPLSYLKKSSLPQVQNNTKNLPYNQMFQIFENHGWINLANNYQNILIKDLKVSLVGVDDPHISSDSYPNNISKQIYDDLFLGVTHAPYAKVLNKFTEDKVNLIFAGHTHGGQIRIPGYGALTSNCDLPTKDARGLSSWTNKNSTSLLHVSAGLGNSKFFPIRFACPPEATLIEIVSLQDSK